MKIETLQTVPGDGKMHPPGTELEVGVDVSKTIARDWLKSGKARPASKKVKT